MIFTVTGVRTTNIMKTLKLKKIPVTVNYNIINNFILRLHTPSPQIQEEMLDMDTLTKPPLWTAVALS